MTVRKVRIDSVADLEALPDDVWFEAPQGINIPFDYSSYRSEPMALRIKLPAAVLKRLRPRRGRRLTARISKGELVIEEAP